MVNKFLNYAGLSLFYENLKSIFPTKDNVLSAKDAELMRNTIVTLQEKVTVLDIIVNSCECGERTYLIDSDNSYITTNDGDLILIS